MSAELKPVKIHLDEIESPLPPELRAKPNKKKHANNNVFRSFFGGVLASLCDHLAFSTPYQPTRTGVGFRTEKGPTLKNPIGRGVCILSAVI